MTDRQIVELVNKSADLTKDLLFSYIAQAELKLHALENILYNKGTVIPKEELEREYLSLMSSHFGNTITLYDSLLTKNRNLITDIRDGKK